jgi:hypothetical protein
MGVRYTTMPTHRTASAQADHWSLRATRSASLAMAPAAMKWTDADEDRHHGPYSWTPRRRQGGPVVGGPGSPAFW